MKVINHIQSNLVWISQHKDDVVLFSISHFFIVPFFCGTHKYD